MVWLPLVPAAVPVPPIPPVWLVELAPAWPEVLDPLGGVVLFSGVCDALPDVEEGLVAVDEDDSLEGDVLLWLEVCPLVLVEVELVLGVEDVADGV